MNTKILAIAIVLFVGLAVLSWLTAERQVDIRSIVPFMRGPDIAVHDLGGLLLVAYATYRLLRFWRGRTR